MNTDVSRRGFVAAASLGMAAPIAGAAQNISDNPPERSGRTVNPEAFGAVADGVMDCSLAFERALRAATHGREVGKRRRSKPIVLSAGVYRLTRTLRLSGQDITLAGSGAQSCVLLLDHEGDGIFYHGGGDSTFSGFTLASTSARSGSSKGGCGFKSEPRLRGAVRPSTLRMTLRDIHTHGQPGTGIQLINPEGARLENITSNGNGGHGCHIWGRDLENILNLLDFCRFRDNALAGLCLDNISASMISRVECLNNKHRIQMIINGHFNHIVHPDCECFAVSGKDRCGLRISGRANRLVGGVFYKLDTAIALEGASDTLVDFPKLDGVKSEPILTAVAINRASRRCTIRLGSRNFVQRAVDDKGEGTIVEIDGRQCIRRPTVPMVRIDVAGLVRPELTAGHVFHYIVTAPAEVLIPIGLQSGDVLTFIIEQDATVDLTFAPAYLGAAAALAKRQGKTTSSLTFIALSDTSLLLQTCNVVPAMT